MIETIIELLNRERGYNLDSEYYARIKVWHDWWSGFYRPFHEYHERIGNNSKTRRIRSLCMAKKVCEDWASILLNEKTEIVVGDSKSSDFLIGKDKISGVLGENDFWKLGNSLIEKAFYSGTGAFVVKLDKMSMQGNVVVQSPDAKIRIEYLTAHNIIPLTTKHGKVVDVAFTSEFYSKGKKYIYLEIHEQYPEGYVITNRYFDVTNGVLNEISLPEGILPTMHTGSDVPLFSVFTPNIVNAYPHSNGLGMSIYAQALDALEGVDYAFNNFVKDFSLGGKKVFYSRSLIAHDDKGRPIVPDDTGQQLFLMVGDAELDPDQKLIQEYNPELRVSDNKDGVQAMLDYLSFKVGFGTKHYQFNSGSIVTATQYMGDKQELVQNASKHYIVIEQALKQLVRAILWAGKEILGAQVNPDAKVTVNFEDSYIIDKESERLRDLQEIRDGIMQKYEYRMKWYGENEKDAKKMVNAERTDNELLGFGGE